MNDTTPVRTPDELRRAMKRRRDWVAGFEAFVRNNGVGACHGDDAILGWEAALAHWASGVDLDPDAKKLCPPLW